MINSLLASILSTINALLALAIVLIGAGLGWSYATDQGYSSALGIAGGLVGGLLVAVMVCGVLALLIDIGTASRRWRIS